ncbi:hypothetical protein Theos_2491 (plasmid) [Thermus oshimai JL-2]|uniref:Uncharacterized protein n=1 Tax=Thermus oshimai JL-2 TaxID=751945 RepID=K7QX04_THEOS|nr:hypothetical protein [Thermus oshimai]AFV77466.1 hypothetical protein Theos_2491 [Thermus oshimai JL-2]
MKGAFATYLGAGLVLAPFGGLTQEEEARLREALEELPEELYPSEWDAVMLLLTPEGVVAHRYAWREARALGQREA